MEDKISVLIIEDNPGDQILLQESLESTSLEFNDIEIAGTLKDAKRLLNKRSFSLIFLDLFLPDSSDLDSFNEIAKINPRIPIIIYSGLSDTKISLKAIALGAQDFLIKGDYSAQLIEKTVRYSIERKRNLEKIEETIERYEIVSKATNDIIWDWDLLTKKVTWSGKGLLNYINNEDEKLISNSFFLRTLHPEDRNEIIEDLNRAILNPDKNEWQSEFRFVKTDGSYSYIYARGYMINDSDSRATRVIGSMQDVTERRLAEEKILSSEKRFKSLVQNGSDLIGIIDMGGVYSYTSPTSLSILGYEPEYLVGKSAFDFIHPEDYSRLSSVLSIMDSEKYLDVPPFRFKRADGKWRWIESNVTNMINDPDIQGIVVNSRDITEKKIADDELRKLSLVAKETINGVIISDTDSKIVWVNDAFTKISGYKLDEIIGLESSSFLLGPETDKETIAYVNAELPKKIPFVFELLNYHKTGRKYFVRVQVQPLFDEDGNFQQYFQLQTDITQQKDLEEKVALEKVIKQKEITEAVITAQEAERSGIGRELHDNVNQILGATRLYIDMARKDEKNRDKYLSSTSDYIHTAIEEIRKLSKSLMTPMIKEMGLIDAIQILINDLMAVQPIEIVLTKKNFSEEFLNENFKLNLFRIVQEQVNNIIKHSQATKVDILFQQTLNEIFISIRDNGIGFDTNIQKKGIGISNINSRVELYKGNINIQSHPGKGCVLALNFMTSTLVTKSGVTF
ncbi:MAG: hypothetical protein NVSMB45_05510 [Ginsengibacter sp.]